MKIRYSDLAKEQEELAKQVITKNSFKVIKTVCGVDVAYKNNIAFASAVIFDKKRFEQIESVNTKVVVKYPYIPGYLFLREAEPVISALKLLKNKYDLLLVDGHGRLHPRRCGFACYLGITLNKPTIGVAKSLLCGQPRDNFVELGGDILGAIIQNKPNKRVFVSVGNKISLKSATKIVQELVKKNEWMPEPLRLADLYSKKQKTQNLN